MRILALDVGDRRIGVAASDPTGIIASPHSIITRVAERRDIAAISELVRENEAELVVVGLPRTLRGEIGLQARRVTNFGDHLAASLGVPVVYWDERHSTVDAESIVRARGKKRGRRVAVDDVAAAVILQGYLDRANSTQSPNAIACIEDPSEDRDH